MVPDGTTQGRAAEASGAAGEREEAAPAPADAAPPTPLSLPKRMIAQIIAHACDDLPNECCGMIAGRDGAAETFYRARNAEASPFKYYIHPQDLIRIEDEREKTGADVLVVYHSHVGSEAYPSETDIRLAQWPPNNPVADLYPEAYYVIVTLQDIVRPAVRAFRIVGGVVTEAALVTTKD